MYGGGGGGGGGGGRWHALMRSDETKPQLTRKLMLRVLSYARAYRWQIAGMLTMILLTTGLTLLTPLIFRRMIDVVIPQGDLKGLVLLALALLLIPVFQGLVGVLQRRWNAEVGEGVIYDLRVALFSKLERMSLRFFTNTRIGELMSRLNNDVVGAQDAISNTIVSIVSNGIEAVALLAVMFALEWRLTLVGAAILPLTTSGSPTWPRHRSPPLASSFSLPQPAGFHTGGPERYCWTSSDHSRSA